MLFTIIGTDAMGDEIEVSLEAHGEGFVELTVDPEAEPVWPVAVDLDELARAGGHVRDEHRRNGSLGSQ